MINPDKDLAQKALIGVKFLRQHAEHMASSPSLVDRISAEPRAMAADAIEQLVKENEKLRAQLVAFQKAANPAVAVDPAAPDGERTCYTSFVEGALVHLKGIPNPRGVITNLRTDESRGRMAFVYFGFGSEPDRWVEVKHLELVPQPDK
ncbi:TPA: hypothetical protein ACIVON_005219 [Salmonella enterica subsp. enterica serovar Poona]